MKYSASHALFIEEQVENLRKEYAKKIDDEIYEAIL